MLSIANLSLTRQGQVLLDQVSMHLNPGEVLAVLGPNGAGKSTLLSVLSGELLTFHSQVRLEQKTLDQYSYAELAQRRAVLPQKVNLDFSFSVQEVVCMGLLERQTPEHAQFLIDQALEQVDMLSYRTRDYLTLSGGEQQRVQLARVLAQITSADQDQARYLLLDESLSSLDLAHQHQVFSVLRQLAAKQSVGVLVVLHDVNLACQYADRLLLMNQGRVVAQGSVAEVVDPQRLSAVYGLALQVLQHPQGWPLVLPA